MQVLVLFGRRKGAGAEHGELECLFSQTGETYWKNPALIDQEMDRLRGSGDFESLTVIPLAVSTAAIKCRLDEAMEFDHPSRNNRPDRPVLHPQI